MRMSFHDLKDQVVIITGSGRGIGKAIAENFAECGAKIVISDIDEDVTVKTAAELQSQGAEVLPLVCDITDRERINDLVNQVIAKWGKIDCLVNNAGLTKDALFIRMKQEDWDFAVNVNLTAVFKFSQAVAKKMYRAKRGNIINLSSFARMGSPGQANYSSAKAGVVALTKTMAKELAPRNIRVNCVAPGFITTRLTEAIPEDYKKEYLEKIPLKRAGAPEEIASVVVFLASRLSSYMTGQVLDVNGGVS